MKEKYIQIKHLLTKYNPQFNALKAMKLKEEIQDLYDLSVGTIKIDEVKGWYKGSYSVEDLTILIIEKKEQLDKFLKRVHRDYSDYLEATDRVKGNSMVVVNKCQRTGVILKNDVYYLNTFIKVLEQVRDERKDKGYQYLEDYEELTKKEIQLLSDEIDRLTEYDIDYEAIKKENVVKFWRCGLNDTDTLEERKEFERKVKAGDPEAVELFEHKQRYKEELILIAKADARARMNERKEKSMTWIEDINDLII